MLFYNELFKKIRESKGMTLEEIGQKVGVTKQTVQKWEAGIAKPRPGKVYAMAKVFGVSAVDISDLRPEKWLVDSIEQVGNGNVAINGSNVHVDSDHHRRFKAKLIEAVIRLQIDPAAKDAVLKLIADFDEDLH